MHDDNAFVNINIGDRPGIGQFHLQCWRTGERANYMLEGHSSGGKHGVVSRRVCL